MSNIIRYISKFFNDVLFDGLKKITLFNNIHWLVISIVLLGVLILVFIYRFMVYKKKTRTRAIIIFYLILVINMVYQVGYLDIYTYNIKYNPNLNIIHLIYTILPLSLPYLSTIILGIIIFSKKEKQILNAFVAFIIPTFTLINLFFIDIESVLGREYFNYFVINGLLLFISVVLIVLKRVNFNFRSMQKMLALLVIIFVCSFVLSIAFEAIKEHSLSVIGNNKGTKFLYNYNHLVSPYTKYRFVSNGTTEIIPNSSNWLLKFFYTLIPIKGLYIMPLLLIIYLIYILIAFIIFRGVKKEQIKNFYKHPIKNLFIK